MKRIGKSRMVHTHEIIGLTPMSAISEFCCSQNENFCCYVALLKLIFQYKKTAPCYHSSMVERFTFNEWFPVRLRAVALKT